MPLSFLLDEQLRAGPLWRAIHHHNAGGTYLLDAAQVGDPLDLPRGTSDADILLWAAREGRLVLSLDQSTLPTHLADHLRSGLHSSGILIIRQAGTMREIIEHLALIAHAGDAADYENTIVYIP